MLIHGPCPFLAAERWDGATRAIMSNKILATDHLIRFTNQPIWATTVVYKLDVYLVAVQELLYMYRILIENLSIITKYLE